MAQAADILTPADMAHTGLPDDRLVALIEDAFALADMHAGYRLSLCGFERVAQLRAILRAAIDFHSAAAKEDPTYMVAGPMSVSYQRPKLTAAFFTPDQLADIRSLVGGPRRASTLSMGLACSPGMRPGGW